MAGTQDAQGRWITRTDRNGNVTLYDSYDARGNAQRIVEGWVPQQPGATSYSPGDTYARLREFEYHPTLNTPTRTAERSALTGVLGDRVTVLDYDDPADDPNTSLPNTKPTTRLYAETRTGKTRYADGATGNFTDLVTYTYNAAGQVTSITGPRPGQVTAIGYDASGHRSSIQRSVTGSSYLETTFSNFDAHGNPQTITDPNGHATAFTYDAFSRVTSVTPPYPIAEQAGTATDPKITFTYDVAGNLTKVEFPIDDASQPVSLAMGYDAKQRLTYLADSRANAIVFEYTDGRMTRETRRTGFVSLASPGTLVGEQRHAYDLAGRLVRSFNPLFASDTVFTQLGPDGNGNPVSVTDENLRTDILLFDALDRLTEIQQIRAATYETTFAYDALSNVTQVTDAAGKATDLLHDDRGNLVETVSPDTGRTRFVYDAAGNLAQKIENAPATGTAGARITSYAYDGLDRLLSIDLGNDAALDWAFTYDTDAAKNQKGRLASVTNGQAGNAEIETTLEYTQRGDVALERTVIDGRFYDVEYAYDAAGNRSVVEGPSGTRVETSFAGLRPSQLAIVAASRTEVIDDLAWAPFGPRTSAKLPPDDDNGANTVTSARTVNLRGQITEIDVTQPSGTVVDRSYVYDHVAGGSEPNDPGPNLDRMIDHQDAGESRAYFYDPLDRLEQATNLDGMTVLHHYAYDAVGNRTSKLGPLGSSAYAYTPATNRIAEISGAETRHLHHDAYGNRDYDGATAYAGTPSLVYDGANRLVEVHGPADLSHLAARFTYDAFGRRIKVETWEPHTLQYFFYDTEGHLIEDVTPGTYDQARFYVYLEDELMALVDKQKQVGTPVAAAPVAGRIEIDPRLGLGALLLLASVGAGLATRRWPVGIATAGSGAAVLLLCAGTPPPPRFTFVHTDPLGTPLAVTNATRSVEGDFLPAKVIWKASYEPFGFATVDEDPDDDTGLFSLHIRFPGQFFDTKTGWHFNFYRTYDPTTGRYLEPDPVGRRTDSKFDYAPALRPRSPRPLEQDVEHLYSYVDNAPTRYFDPLGLIKFDSWGTGGSFGPITFKWSSSNPLRTINEFQTDFELGGGFSFCFLPDPPCHGERPQLPADFNAGYRWLGISTNGNKLCLNLGFSLGLLPIDASLPFLESPPF